MIPSEAVKLTDALIEDPSFAELMKEYVDGQLSERTLWEQLEVVFENLRSFQKENCSEYYKDEESA